MTARERLPEPVDQARIRGGRAACECGFSLRFDGDESYGGALEKWQRDEHREQHFDDGLRADGGTPYEREVEEVPVWERDRSTIERDQLQRALEIYEDSDLTEEHLEAARAKGFSDAAAGKQQTGAGRNTDLVEQLAEEAKDVLGGYFREITMTARKTGESGATVAAGAVVTAGETVPRGEAWGGVPAQQIRGQEVLADE